MPGCQAAIGIGSNSVRLLCARRDASLSQPWRAREETALFLALGQDGCVSQAGMTALVAAVGRMALLARQQGAEQLSLLATSAVRDAANGQRLGEMLAAALPGVPLQVLSGQEEACLAFMGALLPPPPGPLGVIDIGGGSTELALGMAGQRPQRSHSLQLGAARLLTWQAINSQEDVEKAGALARRIIARDLAGVQADGRPFALVGGTGTALLGLIQGIPFGQPLPEDSPINREAVLDWLRRLAGMDEAGRAALTGMPPGRIHILPTGAVILHQLMLWLGLEQVVVSQRNNLDGYLYQAYLEGKHGTVD